MPASFNFDKITALFKRRENKPTVTQFSQWMLETQYTPDIAFLESKKFIPVLEYSDAQRDHVNYCQIDIHSYFRAHAFTKDACFKLLMHDNGGKFAIALKEKKSFFGLADSQPARIRGELHMIEPEGIVKLDTVRQNGVKFKRIPISIDIPFREEIKVWDLPSGHYRKILTGEQHRIVRSAFIYVGIPEYWGPQLDGGYLFPRASYTVPQGAKPKPFYYFRDAKETK